MHDDLEVEARRRAETEAVIPASRRFWWARRFGRGLFWFQIAYCVLMCAFMAFLVATGYARLLPMMLPALAITVASLWFGRRVHFRNGPPSLLLTPEGLRINGLPAFGPIPWDEIEDISAGKFMLSPVIRIKIRDMRSLRARLSPRDRRRLWIYRLPRRNIGLNAMPFGVTPADTAQRLRRYWLYGPVAAESPVEQIGNSNSAPVVAPPVPVQSTAPVSVAPPVEAAPEVQTVGRPWWQGQ